MSLQEKSWAIVLIAGIAGTVALGATGDGPTAKERFSVDRLMEGLDKELPSLEQEVSKLKPVLEQKSEQFQQLIDTKAKQGFMELESLGRDLDKTVGQFRQELDQILSDEQMKKAVTFLETLDDEAIAGVQDEIVAKLEKKLKVAEDEWDKVKPVLEQEVKKQGQLIQKTLKEGAAGLERFQKENAALWKESSKRLTDVLDGDQMKALEAWQSEVGGKIEHLFKGLADTPAETVPGMKR